MNNVIKECILSLKEEMLKIRDSLYNNPELGLKEYEASKLLISMLKEKKFQVTAPFAGMETAFLAEYDSGKPGPSIGILAEYDALPEIGHACGHNMIAAMSFGAACAVSSIINETGGRVIVFGTPDEEETSGKVNFVQAGAFDDIDVALMCHPYPFSQDSGTTLGLGSVRFEFFGKSAHAAQPKEYCQNALDALVLSYLSINNMKQYIPDANIYGIIDNGGLRPNIIPDYASMKYYIRAASKEKLDEYIIRVSDCVINTAKGCNVTTDVTEFENRVEGLNTNKKLMDIFRKNYEEVSSFKMEKAKGYSATSDIGNISSIVPTIHPWTSIGANRSIRLHNIEFAEAVMTEEATVEMLNCAMAIAQTIYDILVYPENLVAIKEEFTSIK